MTAQQVPVSTNCAACGMALRDLTDAQTGLDQQCRAMYGYRRISALPTAERAELNTLVHTLGQDTLRGTELRDAIFRVCALGFSDLGQRIERRVGAATVEVVAPPPPPAPEPPPPPPAPSYTLTQGQERAMGAVGRLMNSGNHGCAVIVGFAGTGKTFLAGVIAKEYKPPVIITPTGKAALRVRQATGLPARTIHSWLYHAIPDEKTGSIKFMRRASDDIEIPESRLVLLDEGSMVGPEIWRDVYSVCEQNDLRLVIIGDGFQLPPVQRSDAPPFSVLTPEFAHELGAERVEMTEILRQAQDSPVIRASMLLRAGHGISALRDLPRITRDDFGRVALAVHAENGVTICHRNATRFQLNAMFRASLGIYDEMPQKGEPLLVLRNVHEAGLVNGESFKFNGWEKEPSQPERVRDRFKHTEESGRFGGIKTPAGGYATVCIEEMHGRLEAGIGAIAAAGSAWARLENFFNGDRVASHVSANFGYVYTAHKSQGSSWPHVLIVLESSVRLDEEDGKRWAYVAVTRAEQMAAVCTDRIV